MNRLQKTEFVDAVSGMIREAGIVVVARYAGLNASQMTDLRDRMHAEGADFKVVKNRLVWRALDSLDRADDGNKAMFAGPTAIACSSDPVVAPRVAMKFAEDHEALEVIGGLMQERLLNANEIKHLAKLPSLDELRAKLVGQLNAPASRIATVLAQPGTQIACIFAMRAQQES